MRSTYTSLFVVYCPYNSASKAVHFTSSLPYKNKARRNEEKDIIIIAVFSFYLVPVFGPSGDDAIQKIIKKQSAKPLFRYHTSTLIDNGINPAYNTL